MGIWVLALFSIFAAWAAEARATVVRASLLPLDAERADTLRSGMAEVIVGLSYAKDERWPYFTEPGMLRSQTRIEAPELGFRIGAGDWAEIQASYELIYLDETVAWGQTNEQYGSGDARLHTKVRLLRESEWPGLGIRFGAKLPNAGRSSRLGTDSTDFDISAIGSKDFGPFALHANMGMLLLGNPGPFVGNAFDAGGQDDLFTYIFAVESAPMGASEDGAVRIRLLAEISGYAGSRFDNDRTRAQAGIRLEHGAGTIYLGTSVGLVTANENLGVRAGIIYSFEPSSWFEN